MSEWKIYRLGDICKNVCSGGTPKSTEPLYYGGDIPWLNTKEVDFCRIAKTEKTITDSGFQNSSTKWIDKNSVIVAMYGATAAKVAVNTIPLTTNQACCNLMIDPNLADFRFVYFYLCYKYTSLAALANGGAQQNLNTQRIKDFEITLPLLKEQKYIADILWALDDKIELNRRINANLEEQAQALFKSWFVDFEPFRDSPFVDSELGKIPQGWKVGTVSEFYKNITIGKTPPRKEHQWFSKNSHDVIWVSIADMGNCGLSISNSSEYLTPEAIKKFNICIVPVNTILLSFKLTIGRVTIADKELATNEAIAHFQTQPNTLEYTYLTLKNYEFSSLGSTSSIATAINSKIIKSIPWMMPSDDILNLFHNVLNPIFDGIRNNIQEITRLSALRDTLLPKLMSSELSVESNYEL